MNYTHDQIDALCELAGIREGTRIRSAMHYVLNGETSINAAAREIGIQPSAVHAAANRIALAIVQIRKAGIQ